MARFRFRIRPGDNKSDPYFLWPPDGTLPPGWEDGVFYGDSLDGMTVWAAPVELRRLQVVFSRVAPTGVSTDPAVITLHFLNLTGGTPDSTWVDADFLTVENGFDTFWAAINPVWPTGTTLDQYRWYKDGSAFHPTPSDGNPAVRVVERNVAGSAPEAPLPPQVAVSLTEKTAIRKRWGRIYLPPPAFTQISAGGMISASNAAAWATAFHDFYETCRSGDIIPVVFSRSNEAAYEIEHVQVDNHYDVIRSRRWKNSSVRETRNVID